MLIAFIPHIGHYIAMPQGIINKNKIAMKKLRVLNLQEWVDCMWCNGLGVTWNDEDESKCGEDCCDEGRMLLQVSIEKDPSISNYVQSPGMFFGSFNGKYFDIPRV
jgi:hypothetical protein